MLSVFDVDGKVIEHGEAMENENVFLEDYVFKATQQNALVKGPGITVTLKDKPGNIHRKGFQTGIDNSPLTLNPRS